MPRVLSVVQVSGSIAGLVDESDTIQLKLSVLEGGRLLGTVFRADSRSPATDIQVINGRANLDLFESTESVKVYSCSFSLVKFNDQEATIIDCASRISSAHGLVGRWNQEKCLGKEGVCDHAFDMAPVRAALDQVEKQTPFTARVDASDSSVGRELLLRGDAVDQNGCVYTTTLHVALHSDGSVTGDSVENGKRCTLAGSWEGNNVLYTLDYPVGGRVTQYKYRGVLKEESDGAQKLSGTWKFEKTEAGDTELFGGFEFVSLSGDGVSVKTIVPGEYVFTGTATADSKTKYDAKVTLHLEADGTLTGKSEELSIAPQTCEISGSWDGENRTISYRLDYTNGGTASYEYVGQLHHQHFVGRWVNPTSADCLSERGDFEFLLTSFKEKVTDVVAVEMKKA